jgi:lipopolysaccharide cholinephosphotransferase
METVKASDYYTPENIKIELIEMLKSIVDDFDKNKIQYWADGGTLLGAVRNGGIIPWDDDIDIGVFKEDGVVVKCVLRNQKGYDWCETYFGYKLFRKDGKPLYSRGRKLPYTYPALDIFLYNNDLSYTTTKAKTYFKKAFTMGNLFPLKKYKFEAFEINGANDAEDYLDRQYGDNWKTHGVIKYNHSTERFYKTPKIFELPQLKKKN